jgi:predicted phosphodiesterase
MRVAALYDVHGNLPALEAVLADVERAGVDRLVFGGDFIWGPFPSETVNLLRALGDRAILIAGNSEREVVDRLDVSGGLPAHLIAPVRWTAERLSKNQLEFVAALPTTRSLDVEGLGPTLFCHATPRSDEEFMTQRTPESVLTDMFASLEQRVVVCGHTHMQYDRTIAAGRIVNPGSVGMPYETQPGAYWALLGPDVQLRRTAYELDSALQRIRATGFPYEGLEQALVTPPNQEDVIESLEEKRRAATSGT